MAEQRQQHDSLKAELIAALDRERAKIARNFDGFRHDIDVPTHLKNSVREHKGWWLTGAGTIGLLLAKLPARRKKVYVVKGADDKMKKAGKAGIALAMAKMAFSAAKPMLTAFATKMIADIAKRQGKKEATRGTFS